MISVTKRQVILTRTNFEAQGVNLPRLPFQSDEKRKKRTLTGKFREQNSFPFIKVYLCHKRDIDD